VSRDPSHEVVQDGPIVGGVHGEVRGPKIDPTGERLGTSVNRKWNRVYRGLTCHHRFRRRWHRALEYAFRLNVRSRPECLAMVLTEVTAEKGVEGKVQGELGDGKPFFVE
jgi:hypothetical protein